MQVIDVLCDDGYIKIFFHFRKDLMSTIRLYFESFLTTLIIEIKNNDRIAKPPFRRRNILNAMAERDNVVPPAAVEPIMRLIGDPARREELRLPGGHVTFGTGRGATKVTMPRMAEWIIAHSHELSEQEE